MPLSPAARLVLALCVATLLAGVLRADEKPTAPASPSAQDALAKPAAPTWEATEAYEVRQVEGWTVRLNKRLAADDPALTDEVIELLRVHLVQVKRAVPATAVEKLKSVVIWIERDCPPHPGMVYHPGADWLRDHGINPEKARCIEIANARNFLDWWRAQPWMVLHEMAHAYHHQFLDGSFGNAEVRDAYERAKKAKLYDSVQHISGRDEKAYAMQDPQEFFAESSEAFFGTNDFYPFVRSELKKHDPQTWEMLRKAWGVGEK